MNFLDPGVNRKVVDNGSFHLHTDFQPNREMVKTLKNGQKWPLINKFKIYIYFFSAKSGLTNVVRTGLNLLRAKYLRNRRIGVFDRKTVFLPNLTNFPDLGVNRKVVDNGLFYLNMKFEQNR